ncbi:TonB-linked outer membrane protein, SusC/RagA family [Sphingobacterium daejeonense]|nr:TonB-linked outer membrane protein, SusC/RagA family [Sphingobacterium daejeonense]
MFFLFKFLGFETQKIKVGKKKKIDVLLKAESHNLEEIVVLGYESQAKQVPTVMSTAQVRGRVAGIYIQPKPQHNEEYQRFEENGFISPTKEALSTFAVDVDAASYSNVRRIINSGQLPQKDAVRVEEMINYFQYDLQAPTNGDPVKIYTELTTAPWNKEHQLMRIALKAKDIPKGDLKPSNLVFPD